MNVVKVANFGQARFIVDEYTAPEYEHDTISGAKCKWMATEVITHALFTHKSDVWSYGKLYPNTNNIHLI